jgi:hypothetical protein
MEGVSLSVILDRVSIGDSKRCHIDTCSSTADCGQHHHYTEPILTFDNSITIRITAQSKELVSIVEISSVRVLMKIERIAQLMAFCSIFSVPDNAVASDRGNGVVDPTSSSSVNSRTVIASTSGTSKRRDVDLAVALQLLEREKFGGAKNTSSRDLAADHVLGEAATAGIDYDNVAKLIEMV